MPSTSPPRASVPCGTSLAACSGARSRPTCSPRPWGGGSSQRRLRRSKVPSGQVRCSASSTRTGPRTTSRCATTRSGNRSLMRLGAFDVVANNADRKSGHVPLAENRLWAIDNGLCFNVHDKLRTVIWDFGGAALEADVQADLARLAHDGVPDAAVLAARPGRGRRHARPRRLAAQPARAAPSWSTTGTGRPIPGPWSSGRPARRRNPRDCLVRGSP